MATPRGRGVARLAALRVAPPNGARRIPAADPDAPTDTLTPLLAGSPDGLVLCDALLTPVRASASARWLLLEGDREGNSDAHLKWAGTTAAAACREAAAAALDRHGVATVTFTQDGTAYQARAAPLDDQRSPVCVAVHSLARAEGDTLLRTAHDLKAPLHAIHGFGALLLRESMGPLSAEQRQALYTIVSETERMRRALNRLLEEVRTGGVSPHDTSQSQTRPPIPTCDLGAVARETAERFIASARMRAITLDPTTTTTLAAALAEHDARTILENLIANALAAVPERGTVRLLVEEGPPGTVTCRVEDSGPGVPDASLERIFEPRFRLPDRGSPDGTGLGLAIARELASRAGGTLVAANRANGGAVFTLTVPRAPLNRSRLIHLAPVTSHAALARAHALLESAAGWKVHSWEDGVLTVELPPDADIQLDKLAAQHGLAGWSAG